MTENNTTAQDFKGSKNRHWLIVRPDGYGDIVLFEPAIRHLRQVYPNDKITILVRNDRIDVRHLFMPGIEWIGFDGDPFGQNIFENGDYIETLKQKLISLAPDVIIAPRFDKTWVEAVAALSCRRARRISMGSSKYDIRTEIWIKNNSVSPPELYPELANEILREDQELVKNSKLALYVTQTPLAVTAPKLTFPKGTTEDVENFIQKNQITKKKYIICVPGGTGPGKRWNIANFAYVLKKLYFQFHFPILIVGSCGENALIDKLTKELIKAGVNSIAWQGADGDFPKMAVLINFSLCYIGNDTGPMHVAAACNIPVVAIFGGGNWPRFLPNCSTGLVFVYYCECFGCSWDCHVEDYPYCLGRVNKRKVYSKLLTFFNNLEGNPAFEVIYDRPRESDVNVILQLTRKSFLTQQEDREARLKVILEQQDELRTLRQYVDELNADREARLKLLLESRSELSELNNKLSVREAKIVDFAYTIEKQEVALATLRKEVDAVNLDRKVRLNLILDQQALLIRLKQKLTDLGDEIEKNLAELEKH